MDIARVVIIGFLIALTVLIIHVLKMAFTEEVSVYLPATVGIGIGLFVPIIGIAYALLNDNT